MQVTINVNGQDVTRDVEPRLLLITSFEITSS